MDKSQQEELSDYDKEWGLDDDTSEDSVEDAEDNQQTETGSTDSESADGSELGTTPDEQNQSSEESAGADDIWAGATEEQRLAFRRAENERVAAENRARGNANRLAERGREMKALRDEKAALQEASRKPTEFETEHEQYGKDIDEMIERRVAAALPAVVPNEELTAEEVEQGVFDVITHAHPDAGEVYNSEGLQSMLSADPVLKHGGRAVLFSELLNADDPELVVAALTHYKQTNPVAAATKTGLEDLVAPEGGSTRHDMRKQSQLTTAEQYDREWELDD